MAWCSNNSAPYIHDLVDVHSANFPETLNKYIMCLRQSGLQRRARTGWLPGDALVFCAQLCDLLHRSSTHSLQRLFEIEVTYHTVCQVCKLGCDQKVLIPHLVLPFWLDEVSTTVRRWFAQSLKKLPSSLVVDFMRLSASFRPSSHSSRLAWFSFW